MANAAKGNGVKYITGDAGYVKKLLYDSDGTCSGAVTADSAIHTADIVVLSTGANTATLVAAKEEAYAASSAICVIQLEPHEIEKYKDIPIIDDFEQGVSNSLFCAFHVAETFGIDAANAGIIFPPDENGLIKLCSCRVVTNYKNRSVPGASIVHSLGDYPYDGCPKQIEDEMRTFIREMLPELADRPFLSTKLCW